VDRSILPTDLVQLEIDGCDVVLGIYWLSKYKVTMDYDEKLIAFLTPGGEMLEFRGSYHQKIILSISTM